jgi:DNA adenine methylase
MSEPRAAFSYYGGKQRMAHNIIPLFPPHTVYVEVHAGGLAVLFAKGRSKTGNGGDYREVINDHDQRIVNFYQIMRDPEHSQELIRRLQWTLYSRAEYARAKEIYKSGCGNDIDRAWAWYVNIQQSFGNKSHAGWGTSVFGQNHAATWNKKIGALDKIHTRLAQVHIECLDQIEIIEKWASPQTCFYVDPPYVGANQGDYAGYTQEDFTALLAALDASGSSFCLSCYDNPALQHYPHWTRHAFKAFASASGQGQTGAGRDKSRAAMREEQGDRERTELVYCLDRSDGMRRESREAIHRLSQGVLWE